MNLDITLETDQPPPLIMDSSVKAKKKFERWGRLNCMSLMIIKPDILETFKGTISEEVTITK